MGIIVYISPSACSACYNNSHVLFFCIILLGILAGVGDRKHQEKVILNNYMYLYWLFCYYDYFNIIYAFLNTCLDPYLNSQYAINFVTGAQGPSDSQ